MSVLNVRTDIETLWNCTEAYQQYLSLRKMIDTEARIFSM